MQIIIFFSFFTFVYLVILCACVIIVLARISNTILNSSGNHGQLQIILSLKGKAFSVLPLSIIFAMAQTYTLIKRHAYL